MNTIDICIVESGERMYVTPVFYYRYKKEYSLYLPNGGKPYESMPELNFKYYNTSIWNRLKFFTKKMVICIKSTIEELIYRSDYKHILLYLGYLRFLIRNSVWIGGIIKPELRISIPHHLQIIGKNKEYSYDCYLRPSSKYLREQYMKYVKENKSINRQFKKELKKCPESSYELDFIAELDT